VIQDGWWPPACAPPQLAWRSFDDPATSGLSVLDAAGKRINRVRACAVDGGGVHIVVLIPAADSFAIDAPSLDDQRIGEAYAYLRGAKIQSA
jgi:hypothetical protein